MTEKLKYDPDYSFEEKDDPRTYYEDTSEDVLVYWMALKMLVDAWSDYRAKAKLYFNATHEETRYVVWHVIEEKYGSDVNRLADHEAELSERVNLNLANMRTVCDLFDVDHVSRQWLYDNLKEAKDYRRVRDKIKRRIKSKAEPVSIRELI